MDKQGRNPLLAVRLSRYCRSLILKADSQSELTAKIRWSREGAPTEAVLLSLLGALGRLGEPWLVLERGAQFALVPGGMGVANGNDTAPVDSRIAACLPALPLENLGDPDFRRDHGLRFAYVAGAMANGIASVELVEAMARAGMLGFFGSAGLELERIGNAIDRLKTSLAGSPFGFNLIHSPNEPDREAATVDLYLRRGIRLVEAAAYLRLTLPVVRYRVTGIARDAAGRVVTPNRIVAKVSRLEVATQFASPPPAEFLNELVHSRAITAEQAQLAAQIPMAQDITAEADSAGHTDNRPLVTLLPTLLALRNRLQAKFAFEQTLRVGAAGGLSTPAALAAAFTMGAAYVVTGSINQACVESGSCDTVRRLLAQAEQADTAMAPAADMFEMGVKVQVLKRGTMFAMRAAKLYELYRTHPSLETLAASDRTVLEKQFFRASLEAAWQSTRAYFQERDPREVERAERDPKHKMALVFRSYLGLSSRWANAGDPTRVLDYQVWCGPAMGAFNEWARGTCLEPPENRHAAQVALSLLHGAAVQLRAQALRTQGVPWPGSLAQGPLVSVEDMKKLLQNDE